MHLVKSILLLVLVCACNRGPPFKPEDYIIIKGCKFLEAKNGDRILAIPGNLCEFDHKGNVFAFANGSLFKFDLKSKTILWKLPTKVFHSISYNSVDDSIYFFSSEIFYKEDIPYLGLTLNAFDSEDGKQSFSWKSSDHLDDLKNNFSIEPFKFLTEAPKHGLKAHNAPAGTRVFLDANQIEVVTKSHPLYKEYDFKEGDLLLSFMDYSLIVGFSPKRNKFLKSFQIEQSYGQIHTPQFIGPNHLLVFINEASSSQRASQVVELKGAKLDNVIWAYPPKLTTNFYSAYLSSVQKLNSNLYFIVDNTPSKEGFYYIKSNSEVVYSLASTLENKSTKIRSKIYKAITIKKDELESFLYGDRTLRKEF